MPSFVDDIGAGALYSGVTWNAPDYTIAKSHKEEERKREGEREDNNVTRTELMTARFTIRSRVISSVKRRTSLLHD